MASEPTHMRREIEEIPEVVRRLLAGPQTGIIAAAAGLRAADPTTVVTIARGSSDHAATYLKYAIELSMGLPVCSMGPSIASIYGAEPKLGHAASLSVSQSGQSPDIVQMTEAVRSGGALAVTLTNDVGSPLARAGNHAIDITAGPERSVAATKTFVASIVAGLLLIGHWKRDQDLISAIEALPEQFERALALDWNALADRLDEPASIYITARGPSLAIASEVALKFKETCQLHAEAYSSAEIMHGPVSIVGRGFPVVCLAARDAAEASVMETCDRLVAQGADVFATSGLASNARQLPFVASGHPLTDPLIPVIQFYSFIERFAGARGLDPDRPPHLNKVTETV